MIARNRNAETLQEFVADVLPIQSIVWGTDSSRFFPGELSLPRYGPIAFLDISHHPAVNIADLARVYATDMPNGEGATEYAVDFWNDPNDAYVRMIFAYESPVKIEFAVVFRCTVPEQWAFLRWIAENDGTIPLADELGGPISLVGDKNPRSMLAIETDIAEQLSYFLCTCSLNVAEAKKKKSLTGLEIVMAVLEAKRYVSFEDIAAYTSALLGMPIQGAERVQFKQFQDHRDVVYAKISRPFQMLLQHVAGQKNVHVLMIQEIPHMVRGDWIQEKEYAAKETITNVPSQEEPVQEDTLPHEAFEDFTANTIAIECIVNVTNHTRRFPDETVQHLPVALLDLSQHPGIALDALVRQGIFDHDAPTYFDWTLGETSQDILIRLRCTYESSEHGHFTLLFHYQEQREFLRWTFEHGDVIPIADGKWLVHQELEKNPVLLRAQDDEFVGSLRYMLAHQVMEQEDRDPEIEEMIGIFFEVKRSLSLQELVAFVHEVLHIKVRGDHEQMIQDAFGEEDGSAVLVQQISREFQVLLLRILVLDGILSGMVNGEVYLFTQEWFDEQRK